MSDSRYTFNINIYNSQSIQTDSKNNQRRAINLKKSVKTNTEILKSNFEKNVLNQIIDFPLDLNNLSNNSQKIKQNSFDTLSNNTNNYSLNSNSNISNDKNSGFPNYIINSNEEKKQNKRNKEIENLLTFENLFLQQNQINTKIRYVCIYCNKDFHLKYIYEINNNNILVYYCYRCFVKIISKINGPLTIYRPNNIINENEIEIKDYTIDDTYQAKIQGIQILHNDSNNIDHILDNKNLKEFIFKENVPIKLKTHIIIENNGEKEWPNNCEIVTLNKTFKSTNDESNDKKKVQQKMTKNETIIFYKEFIDLKSFYPGEYHHILGIQYIINNQKKIFGIKDLTFKIKIRLKKDYE